MKKQYVKPEMYFENFELSTNIATGCATIVNYQEGTCTYTVSVNGIEGNVFLSNTQGCVYTNPDDAGICYHSPADDSVVFSS